MKKKEVLNFILMCISVICLQLWTYSKFNTAWTLEGILRNLLIIEADLVLLCIIAYLWLENEEVGPKIQAIRTMHILDLDELTELYGANIITPTQFLKLSQGRLKYMEYVVTLIAALVLNLVLWLYVGIYWDAQIDITILNCTFVFSLFFIYLISQWKRGTEDILIVGGQDLHNVTIPQHILNALHDMDETEVENNVELAENNRQHITQTATLTEKTSFFHNFFQSMGLPQRKLFLLQIIILWAMLFLFIPTYGLWLMMGTIIIGDLGINRYYKSHLVDQRGETYEDQFMPLEQAWSSEGHAQMIQEKISAAMDQFFEIPPPRSV